MPALDYSRIAHLYDAVVRYDGDLRFLVETARARREAGGGALLELMAGTGRVSLPLLEAGLEPTCVELVPAMLEVLRARARERDLVARLCCADVVRLPFAEMFDLAVLPFQGFGELVDEAEQRGALVSVRRALRPGGRLVLTLHNPPVRLRSVRDCWTSHGRFRRLDAPGEVELRLKTRYEPERRRVYGLEQFRVFGPFGDLEEERTLALDFSLVDRARFEELAAEAGFRVESLAGGFRGEPFEDKASAQMVWTLAKR